MSFKSCVGSGGSWKKKGKKQASLISLKKSGENTKIKKTGKNWQDRTAKKKEKK